jgi:hypothetical protein
MHACGRKIIEKQTFPRLILLRPLNLYFYSRIPLTLKMHLPAGLDQQENVY